MANHVGWFRSLLASRRTETGQGLVEYALLLILVAVVAIVIVSVLGPGLGNIYSNLVATM